MLNNTIENNYQDEMSIEIDNTVLKSKDITNKRIDIKNDNIKRLEMLTLLYSNEIDGIGTNITDKDKLSYIINFSLEKLYKDEETLKRFHSM